LAQGCALLTRRTVVAAVATGLSGLLTAPGALALPARPLVFARDHGAHPDLRTEWWYVTGHARSAAGEREFGFQLTFFRTRVDATQGLQSSFAARQLIFAHAALTDVQGQKLWHDQRIAREGFGLALAGLDDTKLKLADWTLQRRADTGRYTASLVAQDFGLQLQFAPTQALLLQGRQGLSRKGPDARQASYYYSQPQLTTSGQIRLRGQTFDVSGKAWLDHEWSDELLHPEARGWDWIGMNLDDGSALTAFALRRADGSAVWDGGSFRTAQGALSTFSRGEVIFKPVRYWQSPLTQARYPVDWEVRTPAGLFTVKAVIDGQELDSRQSTGAVYWEGLSDLLDSTGRRVGRGYLEMTGYAAPLRL
jgi:predicted secreted hydrolase